MSINASMMVCTRFEEAIARGQVYHRIAVVQYLQERNPFSNNPRLWYIATGVHAHLTINVDTAHSVGAAIRKSMEWETSDEQPFRRNDQVVTLGTKSSMERKSRLIHSLSSSSGWSTASLQVQVDPQPLFKLSLSAQSHRWRGSPGWSTASLPKIGHCCPDIKWTVVGVPAWIMQLCLIPLSCSEKHTSQPLLMPSGFFFDLTSRPMSKIKTVDMSWTRGHSFNEYQGHADLHTNASSTSTLIM